MEQEDLSQGVDLTGQVAIVTGGGRGIGRAIAQGLAKAGAAVAVVDRTELQVAETVRLIEDDGGRAIALHGDVTDVDRMVQVVAETESELGPVDLLVSNAAIIGPLGPAWENDPEAWCRCIDVNLHGTFLTARAVLPGMVARSSGRIVITASGAGTKPWYGGTSYTTSKCAVIHFAECLAGETERHGIRVFSFNPGLVRTAMSESMAGTPWDEEVNQGLFRRLLAEGHVLPPERAAELVVFLASGRADSLSGRYIVNPLAVSDMLAQAEAARANEFYTMRLRTP